MNTKTAKALSQADVKVISNTGSPTEGLTGVMDLFSSKGGTQVGAMLEALSNTEQGQAMLGNFIGSKKVETSKGNPLTNRANGNGKGYTNGAAKA